MLFELNKLLISKDTFQSNERLCTVTRFETEANATGREASQSVRTQYWSVDFL